MHMLTSPQTLQLSRRTLTKHPCTGQERVPSKGSTSTENTQRPFVLSDEATNLASPALFFNLKGGVDDDSVCQGTEVRFPRHPLIHSLL